MNPLALITIHEGLLKPKLSQANSNRTKPSLTIVPLSTDLEDLLSAHEKAIFSAFALEDLDGTQTALFPLARLGETEKFRPLRENSFLLLFTWMGKGEGGKWGMKINRGRGGVIEGGWIRQGVEGEEKSGE